MLPARKVTLKEQALDKGKIVAREYIGYSTRYGRCDGSANVFKW